MKKRVDIELPEEVLKWAKLYSGELNISRRQFLSNVITRAWFLETNVRGSLEFIHSYPGGNRTLPLSYHNPYHWYELHKTQQQPKCSSDE